MIIEKSVLGPEEFCRLGKEIFERDVRPKLGPQDDNNFVAIDILSGDFELDKEDYPASERLLKRRPHAQIWLERVGQRAAYRIGGRA
jgi:hypothetical protein